jgi:anti-sigma regulatory factor (Ser/Thr protein kinase)
MISDASKEQFCITIINKSSQVTHCRERVRQFLKESGSASRTVHTVEFVLEELLTNLIRYGYHDAFEHEITVCVFSSGENITIQVDDDAKPFDPRDSPSPHRPDSLQNAPNGGLGIKLVKGLVQDISYNCVEGKNRTEVRIAKELR